jgi:hypothetical protein
MPAGRPSDYRPEYVQKAKDYIASCGREATELPTMEGLSHILGADDTTVQAWSEAKNPDGTLKNPEFLAALKDLKQSQKTQLMNDGLYGGKDVNSTMAIFLLKVNHGMIETERKMLVGEKGAEPVQIISYGNSDPLQLYANPSNASSPNGSSSVSGTQLAPQGTQDNAGSEPTDQMGEPR